jgi:hypothetical protein
MCLGIMNKRVVILFYKIKPQVHVGGEFPSCELGPPTPSAASECVPPPEPKGEGGEHTRLRVRGCMGGGPNWEDWRKSLELCLLCGMDVFSDLF